VSIKSLIPIVIADNLFIKTCANILSIAQPQVGSPFSHFNRYPSVKGKHTPSIRHSFLESNEYFRFSSSTQLSLNSNSLDALGNSNITTPSLADRSLMEEDQHEEENNQSTTCSVECPDASGPPAGRCRASPPYSRPPTQGPASQRTKSKREKKGGHK
jgi:hypothetical protein